MLMMGRKQSNNINVSSALPGMQTSLFKCLFDEFDNSFTSIATVCVAVKYFHCEEVLQWLFIMKNCKEYYSVGITVNSSICKC